MGTLVSVGAIVIAGSLFANASDEPSAVADITPIASEKASDPNSSSPSLSTPVAVATPPASKIEAPAIAQMPMGGEDDDDDDEHEGRGERREHRDRYEEHDDGDDD